MIITMLCVPNFVILVVWFLLPWVERLMIHTTTVISIFVCMSMLQLMSVFISIRCTLCAHFLQIALTLILVFSYAHAASLIFFFLNDPAPPEFSPLSLPDALPICLPIHPLELELMTPRWNRRNPTATRKIAMTAGQ